MKTIYLRYDPKKSERNIMGLHTKVPEGYYIVITAEQEALITRFPNNFLVKDNKLVQLEDTSVILQKISKKKKESRQRALNKALVHSPILVKGSTFEMKTEIIQALNLNLNICSIDKDHVTYIECKVDGKPTLKEMKRKDLLELAKAFDVRRVEISKDNYN